MKAPYNDEEIKMELREFIALTLTQIQSGVQDAISQVGAAGTSGVINPVWGTTDDIGAEQIVKVNFDVAVSATDRSGGGVEGGLSVMSFRVGGNRTGSSEASETARIQFSVAVVNPVTTVARSLPPL